ncbi:flagellar operon protein [Bacillus oleivorans]|uniref:Flagellar operon protein n=1 Tax=Bacillus oleivorans TaxID=1448271 RepID=A0A285D1H8_9BACI|nr:TIGR02530 family flagellar biosynthesis protein [Bacillus oleivorans]SNX73660.1 flagellar operon protein [Bacillus oleivorans]
MKPIYVSNFPKLPIVQTSKTQPQPSQAQGSSFSNHLKEAIQQQSGLKASKHAMERMNERGIQLDESSWSKLQSKVLEAKQMGLKESLVLMKDSAFIVSANNETIITAMSRKEANEQIFTNITGTIVLE